MPKKKIKSLSGSKSPATAVKRHSIDSYQEALTDIKRLVQQARYASARAVNAVMIAAYWEIGRRIVQVEQKGKKRADYGERIIEKLSRDLTKSCGKGFGGRKLERCRQFFLFYSKTKKSSTVLTKSLKQLKKNGFLEIQEKLPEIFPLS